MKWGILATGTIAAKFADTINRMEGQQLVACASRSAEKAAAFAEKYSIPHAHGSYEALAADPEVEVIYIATPNNLHGENCRLCLGAGKHVLCEKPLTPTRTEGEALFALAKEKGLFLMEGFWIRHLPVLVEMQRLLAQDAIGDVVYARSDYGFIARGARKDRKFDSALAGGALLDIGVYNLGFMRMVMGDADPEDFSSRFHINEYGTDDFSSVLLRYPGGRTATVTTAIGVEMPRAAVIYGTEGRMELEDFQAAQRLTVYPAGKEPFTVEIPFEVNGFEYQVLEAERCIRGGSLTGTVLKPEDTLAVLGQMDALRQAWGMKFDCE